MCEALIDVLKRHWHFYRNLPVAGNFNATLTVADHWDAYLGLRLTTSVLYCTLTCRPKLEEGLWMSILFTTIFTALSR